MAARDDGDRVWYVAYGSNLLAERFACYLAGGRPVGARRRYPGCRDPSPPRAAVATWLHGGLTFAGESGVWGGGMAFYDTGVRSRVAARAYLLTVEQFNDVVAQEIRRAPGTDLGLAVRWARPGARVRVPGHYEAVLCQGHRGEVPVVTLTSVRPPAPTAPSAAYLRTLLAGLRETHGWSPAQAAAYLSRARGVAPRWSARAVRALVEPA